MGVVREAVQNRLRVARVACPHDCPDACLMRVTVDTESGRAIKVEGDPTHPVTRGYLCNKVNHYLDLVYNDQRVLYPHRRVGPKGPGAKFQRITWDEALTEVAARLEVSHRRAWRRSRPAFFLLGHAGYSRFSRHG